jgi:D-alanyl-D-alanine dipeptidase
MFFRKFLFLLAICLFVTVEPCFALTSEACAKGFVYLHEVDPTILVSLRYNTSENFVAKPVKGYKKAVVIMTKQAALALKEVQEEVKKDGYSLVVYDAYRPQQAVDNFISWSEDIHDQSKKKQYYPRVDKSRVFELGYVAQRSGHSRGSTVDLTLIKLGNSLHPVQETKRALFDGFTITFLDDGTVDMGSSFDLFDIASHVENKVISEPFKSRRAYLKKIMEKHGFKNYSDEWWHFTLKNEPYPADRDDSYFNFEVA